jgi:hypothetical protein
MRAGEAPAAAEDRGADRRVEICESGDGRLREPGDGGDTIRRPGPGALAERLDTGGLPSQERLVDRATLEQRAGETEGEDQVGARTNRQVEVRHARQRCGARVDHDQRRAGLAGLLDVRHQVDARGRGIGAPHDDEPCVCVVLVGDAGHLAVHGLRGQARRRGAHRAGEA